MQDYLLQNLSEFAIRRAINLREEAQLWDILARDLKREARRTDESSQPQQRRKPEPVPSAPTFTQSEKLFVRISEASRMMGIGRSSLYKAINQSRLKARKTGKMTLIAVSDIEKWFDDLPLSK